MSGEVFGMLIAVLFLQEAIRGMIFEFREDNTPGANMYGPALSFFCQFIVTVGPPLPVHYIMH
jgi:hypothetical protein